MRHITTLLATLTLLACGNLPLQAQHSSANNAKMKLFLSQYPQADANGDKVLSVAEMRLFVMKNVSSSATSENNQQLKKFFRHAPQADLNGDSVLKKSELINYLGSVSG
mgnify:CR=1 FL=1